MLIEKMINDVVTELESHNADYDNFSGQYGNTYRVKRPQATLDVVIDAKWVGYSLEVSPKLFGKTVGFAEDTDNYPLTDAYEKETVATFEAAKLCLHAFLEDKVFGGVIEDSPALAMPALEAEYKMTIFKRFTADTIVFSEDELTKVEELKPLSEYPV